MSRKFLIGLIVVLLASAAVLGALAVLAFAHPPEFPEPGAVTRIQGVDQARSYYLRMESEIQTDTFVLEAEAGKHLHAAISVPKITGMDEFQVDMVLLGPGLPPIASRELPEATTLSPELGQFGPVCEGFGTGIVCPPELNGDFFEPFTQTRYYRRQALEIDLPETGTYNLIITGAGGATGKYVLGIGTMEELSPVEIAAFPTGWVKIHAWFGQTPWLIGGLAVLAIVVAAGAAILIRRKKKAPLAGSPSK